MSRIARVWAVLRSAGYERVRGLAEALAQREVKGSPTLVWGICAKTLTLHAHRGRRAAPVRRARNLRHDVRLRVGRPDHPSPPTESGGRVCRRLADRSIGGRVRRPLCARRRRSSATRRVVRRVENIAHDVRLRVGRPDHPSPPTESGGRVRRRLAGRSIRGRDRRPRGRRPRGLKP